MDKEKLLGLIAQAWCTKENEHKEMDVVLAEAIVQILNEVLLKEITNLKARVEELELTIENTEYNG